MPAKIMKKQVSLPVRVAPAKQDLDGEKDTDPLLRNCQSVDTVENKDQKDFKMPKKYEQPIHPIPSSTIVLTDEERLELESVLFELTLKSVGL